jgi:hypothetical protein
MSYQPQDPEEHQEIIDLVNQSIEDNKECCLTTQKYLIGIMQQLYNQQQHLDKLLRCCNYRPIRPYITPGDILNPPVIPIPIEPRKRYTSIATYQEPKRIETTTYESYDTPFYSHSNVINLSGKYRIDGDRYINEANIDLRNILPLDINIYDATSGVLLESILDYRIVTGGGLYPRKEVILVYATKKGEVKKTFEGGLDLYRRWYKIHSGMIIRKPIQTGRTFQRGKID